MVERGGVTGGEGLSKSCGLEALGVVQSVVLYASV